MMYWVTLRVKDTKERFEAMLGTRRWQKARWEMKIKGARGCFAFILLGFLTLSMAIGQSGTDHTLTVLVPADFPNLDPCETVSGDQSMVMYHIYSRLYTFNENMEPVPDLVTHQSTSKDGTTWTFDLRQGVKFTDGTPVNAEAVKYTIDRMKANKCGQEALFTPIKEVRVDSEYQLTIVTNGKFPALLNNLAHPDAAIIDPTADKKLGKQYGLRPVGSGPYELKEWVTDDHITLVRNDQYYGATPYFDTIIFKFVPDETTRTLLIDTGQADVALRISPNNIARLKTNPSLAVDTVTGRTMFYQFNVTQPPFDNQKVRLAANYAVNKAAIVDRILFGAGEPSTSLVESVQYTIDAGSYKYDPQKAKELIQEADAAGAKVVLLTPTSRYPQDQQVSQAVAGYLREAGLDVQVQAISDWPSYVDAVSHHKFNMFLLGWGGSTGDPDNAFRRTLGGEHAGQLWNPGGYNNPEVNQLIQAGSTEFDIKKRAEIYAKLQKLVWGDAPWLFMYRETTFLVHKANIQGIKVLPGTEQPYFWLAHR